MAISTTPSAPKRLVPSARRRFTLLVGDHDTRRFIGHNRRVWGPWRVQEPTGVILADYHGLASTLISYTYFLNVLARKHRSAVHAFTLHGRRPFPGSLSHRALDRVWQSFNTSGFMTPALTENQKHRAEGLYQETVPKVTGKQALHDLRIAGLWLGIDIYESYLKRYLKPTPDFGDPRLHDLMKEACESTVFWLDYFDQNRVTAVVLSHDQYVEHNIQAKIAYERKIPVYLPNIRGITYASEPFSPCSHFPRFREIFRAMPLKDQEDAIGFAKTRLERRLSGEVGVDMPYSTRSGYVSANGHKPVLRPSNKPKVLIATHCFFDNPHAYNEILFTDFYEWVRFLGKVSEKTDYDWYLKVHPDPLPGTMEIVQDLMKDFPKITVIPAETSHHQLVKEGVTHVLTAYGSIGHEYPALGVQVVNAGYNPRVAYDFNWHPRSIEEYERMLMDLPSLRKTVNMDDLYEFYYMHHRYTYASDLFLDSYWKFTEALTPKDQSGPPAYKYFLDRLSEAKHQEVIRNVERFIESGKRHYMSRGPE